MNWLNRIKSWVSPKNALPSPAAHPQPQIQVFRESMSAHDRDYADYGYRHVSGQYGRRDMLPGDYQLHLDMCNQLWMQNPIAKKGVQNMRAFVASEGYRVRATCSDDRQRESLQKLLDEHWELNQWEDELSRRVETLGVEGEWIYFVPEPNPHTGHFQIARILPEQVRDITRCALNAERLKTVELQSYLETVCNGDKAKLRTLEVCHRDALSRVEGNCLYLGINRLSGQTRGWSDLLVVSRYIDVLEKLVFTETDRVSFQRAHAWDVTIKAGSPEKLLEARDRISREKIQPGSILIHDENEVWDVKSPQLHLGESIDFQRFVMAICFGGLGMPQHFFSEGGDVNKATASEMGTPVWAHIRDRKRAIQGFLRLEIELALRWLRECGRMFWIHPECETFEVVSRDPERNAYDLTGKMLKELGEALALGQQSNWITPEDAGRAYRTAGSSLGVGDFHDAPEPATLADAANQVDQALAAKRPQLENVYPLAPKRATA